MVGNNEDTKTKSRLRDAVQILVFLILLSIPAYFCYKVLLPLEFDTTQEEETNQEDNQEEKSNDIVEDVNEEEVAQSGDRYEETFVEIEGQMAYIAVPTYIDKDSPATIVIYSHGSNTLVTEDTTDSFIQDLQAYGELFTTENLIFAASNEHGANWGSTAAVQDIQNLIDYIGNNYNVAEKIYMIGFSMGGLPTTHYATEYPVNVSKITLLAPTTRDYEWDATTVEDTKDIEIKIWHGTDDVNIGIIYTDEFVDHLADLGKDVELVRLQGKSHFDLDAEYMNDVLEFFIED